MPKGKAHRTLGEGTQGLVGPGGAMHPAPGHDPVFAIQLEGNHGVVQASLGEVQGNGGHAAF